jgi:hypothetical protein
MDLHRYEYLLKLGLFSRTDNARQIEVSILQDYPVEVLSEGYPAPKSA